MKALETVDKEKSDRFRAVFMHALSAYLTVQGVTNVSTHDVFNATMNALCGLLRVVPDEGARVNLAAQCVRLLLDDAGCEVAAVLTEVEKVREIARFVESGAAGRA